MMCGMWHPIFSALTILCLAKEICSKLRTKGRSDIRPKLILWESSPFATRAPSLGHRLRHLLPALFGTDFVLLVACDGVLSQIKVSIAHSRKSSTSKEE